MQITIFVLKDEYSDWERGFSEDLGVSVAVDFAHILACTFGVHM